MKVELSASTRVVGVVGDPVEHSLSPAIHNAAFSALGLDWVFVAFPAPAGFASDLIRGTRALGIAGLSVTMPHKELVAESVDELSERAERLKAVNVVVLRKDGSLYGDSTDGQGFVDSLASSSDFDPEGMRCLVAGAGGAARAIVLALADAGAQEVVVVNRDRPRGLAAAALAGGRGRVGSSDDIEEADLVVQATSVGMGIGESSPPPVYTVDPTLLGPGQLVVDIVYHPVETPFLREAASAGASVINGVGMLVHQAARAFQLWTGTAAPLDVMEEAANEALKGSDRPRPVA